MLEEYEHFEMLLERWTGDDPATLLFIDFSKAFDSINLD